METPETFLGDKSLLKQGMSWNGGWWAGGCRFTVALDKINIQTTGFPFYCGQVPSMVEFDPMQVSSVYMDVVSYTRKVPLDFCTKGHHHLRCVSTSAHDPPCALHNVRRKGQQLPEGGGHMFDCALHSPLLKRKDPPQVLTLHIQLHFHLMQRVEHCCLSCATTRLFFVMCYYKIDTNTIQANNVTPM